MNSSEDSAVTNVDTRPTMQDLWRMHPEIQNATMIEAPGIPYLRVVYVFCGFKVTQQEFDAVLTALNRLTGCHYTQDDIAGVQIAPSIEHSRLHSGLSFFAGDRLGRSGRISSLQATA